MSREKIFCVVWEYADSLETIECEEFKDWKTALARYDLLKRRAHLENQQRRFRKMKNESYLVWLGRLYNEEWTEINVIYEKRIDD